MFGECFKTICNPCHILSQIEFCQFNTSNPIAQISIFWTEMGLVCANSTGQRWG